VRRHIPPLVGATPPLRSPAPDISLLDATTRAVTAQDTMPPKAALALPFESSLAAGLQPSAPGGLRGSYSICSLRLGPALVIARLLDVLGRLDPDAHARLTSPWQYLPVDSGLGHGRPWSDMVVHAHRPRHARRHRRGHQSGRSPPIRLRPRARQHRRVGPFRGPIGGRPAIQHAPTPVDSPSWRTAQRDAGRPCPPLVQASLRGFRRTMGFS